MVLWHKLAGFLVIGYLIMARSFAYVGIAPLRIFIGELALGAFLFLKPHVVLQTWVISLVRWSPLNLFSFSLLFFMLYGVLEVGRGLLGGSSLTVPLKCFVFNYYALFSFLGIWVGVRRPDFLPKLVRALAWANGTYGLVYVLMLKNLPIYIPGTGGMPLFGAPGGSAVAILGLLAFERNLIAVWPLLLLNTTVTLAMQVRAEWLGLSVGLFAWGLLTGHLGRVFAMGLAGLAVIGVVELADVKIAGRGDGIAIGNILSHAIAPIDTELAQQFSPHARDSAGSVRWREQWWEQIWSSAHSTPTLAAFGHGYGFDLFSLASDAVRMGQAADIRTPHNVFYYALGYTGWVGVALFGLLQLAILRVLWRAFRVGQQVIGVVWWAAGISTAFFSNFFETPFGAIPFYLLMGMAMAPGLQLRGEQHAHPARP
jgi:hypothetical protein